VGLFGKARNRWILEHTVRKTDLFCRATGHSGVTKPAIFGAGNRVFNPVPRFQNGVAPPTSERVENSSYLSQHPGKNIASRGKLVYNHGLRGLICAGAMG